MVFGNVNLRVLHVPFVFLVNPKFLKGEGFTKDTKGTQRS